MREILKKIKILSTFWVFGLGVTFICLIGLAVIGVFIDFTR